MCSVQAVAYSDSGTTYQVRVSDEASCKLITPLFVFEGCGLNLD